MFGTIFYAIGCFVAAMVLASLLVIARPMGARDDMKPWKTFIGAFIFCLVLPFAYCEVLTKAVGAPMAEAISKAYSSASCSGPMRYYRVVSYQGKSARALIVGEDRTEIGIEESPVLSVNLSKGDDGSWNADSYKVMTSGRLNQDHFVFPPYY